MMYIVQPGDSLYSISRIFGLSAEELQQANLLEDNALIPGENLYIPLQRQPQTTSYTVRAGDSLFSIARRFNTTVESIMTLNNLTSTSLTIGQRLRIPLYTEAIVNVNRANIRRDPALTSPVVASMVRSARLPVTGSVQGWYRIRLFDGTTGWVSRDVVTIRVHDGSRPIISNVGFYTLEEGPGLPSSYSSFVNNTTQLSEVPLFMWRISANNPTEIERFGQFTDQDVRTLVAIGHRNNIKMMPVIHNLLYRPGGTTLAKNVIKVLVSDPRNRSAFIQNVLNLIEEFDFDGVNIDIEDVFIEDSRGVSALYTELGAAMKRRGYYLSASVPARVSDQPFNPFSDPFEYGPIGRAVDQFVVMLYNEHGWPGSGPGPVVSRGWMERVLNYTITKMPREKVVAAVSVFGFDFNLTTKRNTYVTYPSAMNLAQRYNKTVIFDEETQTPMFAYRDAQGNDHEVWFENAASIRAKANQAWRLGISGLALWRLGMEDPAIWTMFARDTVIRKL
ncbi:MAG: LysM peptidoglycan-binding domain-containing protein [Clostridia bacterium]|nr:LysM peptidoglycan-binding domain-containing protein [Clostridia bacterium]